MATEAGDFLMDIAEVSQVLVESWISGNHKTVVLMVMNGGPSEALLAADVMRRLSDEEQGRFLRALARHCTEK